MFGLTFEKLVVIGLIAAFLLGPSRLPHYAQQLAKLTRNLRDMANGARDRMADEMGPEFQDLDWRKLDPRQYDPRRIIREALLEGDDDFEIPDMDEAPRQTVYAQRQARLSADTPPPFDAEAT